MGLAGEPPSFRAWYGLLSVQTRLQDRVAAELEAETGLVLSSFELLAHLYWHPDGRVRMSELADDLLLSRGGATRQVARLEEVGLLDREIPRTDRRATFAVITAAGRATFERAYPLLVDSVQRHLGSTLDEDDLAHLIRIMAKVLREVDPGCAAFYEAEEASA